MVARKEGEVDEFAKPFAAGAVHPHRLGGEFVRCAIEEPQPQSRSQQWHWWHHGTHWSNCSGSTTKRAFGAAKGALKGGAVQCRCALVRRADQGEPPARQATETTLGSGVEQ